MRDHTMSVPAPENTVAFGIPNACTDCHADRPAAWAVEPRATWWPDGSPREARRAGRRRLRPRAPDGPDALERLIAIAADDRQGPLIQANAVGYLRGLPGPRAAAALLAAIKSPHPAIRIAAASGLGSVATADGSGRAALLAALDDDRTAVRVSALASLVNLRAGPFAGADGERFRRVSAEYIAAGRSRQDDAGIQTDVGMVHLLNGDLASASAALQNALALEPGLSRRCFRSRWYGSARAAPTMRGRCCCGSPRRTRTIGRRARNWRRSDVNARWQKPVGTHTLWPTRMIALIACPGPAWS